MAEETLGIGRTEYIVWAFELKTDLRRSMRPER